MPLINNDNTGHRVAHIGYTLAFSGAALAIVATQLLIATIALLR